MTEVGTCYINLLYHKVSDIKHLTNFVCRFLARRTNDNISLWNLSLVYLPKFTRLPYCRYFK